MPLSPIKNFLPPQAEKATAFQIGIVRKLSCMKRIFSNPYQKNAAKDNSTKTVKFKTLTLNLGLSV
tara:strand:- start:288 stop:485 length:198 start_codon:yes stop_codon:yes gene_type:complete